VSWSSRLTVRLGGSGTIAHAGVVLPRLLADRVGLTSGLAAAVARAGFDPVRDRGRVLVDAACALIAGATCVTDVEAMTCQVELFGPTGGASDSTLSRVLGELGERIGGTDLPTRRLAAAVGDARARAWQAIVTRHGSLPAVQVAGRALTRTITTADGTTRVTPVTVIRLDGTLIDAASNKSGARGTWKGGFGLHPLTAWCSNVGDNLAVMLRPGNAGTFTATDHIAVLTAAVAQVPAAYQWDLLVTVDGAGASHALIEHVSGLNTHPAQGGRVGGWSSPASGRCPHPRGGPSTNVPGRPCGWRRSRRGVRPCTPTGAWMRTRRSWT
jgi:DDE family transposase